MKKKPSEILRELRERMDSQTQDPKKTEPKKSTENIPVP